MDKYIKLVGCLFKMFFALAMIGVVAYVLMVVRNPKVRAWATAKGGPTPFAAVNSVLAMPAQAVGKTESVVAANNKRVATLDKLIAEDEGKKVTYTADDFGSEGGSGAIDMAAVTKQATAMAANATAAAGGTAAAAAPGAPGTPSAAGNASAAAPAPPGPPVEKIIVTDSAPTALTLDAKAVVAAGSNTGHPAPSAAFIAWAEALNVGGVIEKKPHRILVNYSLVYEGEEADAKLGIRFDHLDLDKKLIIFRDVTGAEVTRAYTN